MTTWQEEKQEDMERETTKAQGLVGKTIVSAVVTGHDPDNEWHPGDDDCVNLLTLTMSDGSVFYVFGGYGGYTGNSCDEYVQVISVTEKN